MDFNIGDLLIMKKNHPCGGNEFEVRRVGADIGIKCLKCGRYVLVPRSKLIKNIKSKKGEEQ